MTATQQEYVLTTHAIDMYMERMRLTGSSLPKDPEKSIRKMLKQAVEVEIKDVYKTLRLINNGFRDVKYLEASGWRFVVSPENVILTIEHTNKAFVK